MLQGPLSDFLFANTNQAVILCDKDVKITHVNAAFCSITGYSAEEAIGRNPRFLSAHKQSRDVYREMWAALNSVGQWQGELWNQRKDGRNYIERICITHQLEANGESTGYFALFDDFTAEKLTFEKLKYRVNHDILTSAFNRSYIELALDLMLEECNHSNKVFSLVYINLDNFRKINDRGGQDLGDKVLKVIADRLLSLLRESDILGRIGGDEFCIILEGVKSQKNSENFTQKILQHLCNPIVVDGYVLETSGSAGVLICSGEDKSLSPSQLVNQASQAMTAAKRGGGNRYVVYESNVGLEAQREATLLADLKGVIERGELEVHYQAIRDLKHPSHYRYEALVRWQHPLYGQISPMEFIPLAEINATINDLGKYVIESACQQIIQWKRSANIDAHISVNVSPQEFQFRSVAVHLLKTLENYGVEPQQIGVEVTENKHLHQNSDVTETFKQLQNKGISVSIDDFGTGYSSFSYLKDLSFDVLKIDKRFVDHITEIEKDKRLVYSIIEMSHRLGLQVVAEGVEDKEQYALLESMDCDYIQGYYLSRPISGTEIEKTFPDTQKNKTQPTLSPVSAEAK